MTKTRTTKSISVLLIPLRSILFVIAGLALGVALEKTLTDISEWWTTIDIAVNVITIGALHLVCRSKGIGYDTYIHYEKGRTDFKSAIKGLAIVLIISMAGMYGAGFICYGEIPHFPAMMVKPIPLWVAVTSIFILPITTTLAEDGVYLGAINQSGSTWTLVLSVFFYAAQHSFIPLIPDTQFIIYRFISFLPAAAVMCVWYRKHKNPLPIMIGHFIVNIPTVVVLIATSASPELYGQWVG